MEIKNLNISLKNDRQLIYNLNLTIGSMDKIAIIGEEGNGKSTLLQCMYDPDLIKEYCNISGEVLNRGKKLGYLEQFLNEKFNELNVVEYILSDNEKGINISYEYADISDIYRIFIDIRINIDYIITNKKMKNLSGGEKVKVQIAKLLYNNPDILLLDEPTNDLDIDGLKWLEKFILNSKIPVVYISHDELLLENTANAILHLEQINNKKEAKYTFEKIGYKEYVEKRLYNISRQTQISKKEHQEFDKKQEKYRKIYEQVKYDQENISRQNPSGGRLLKKKMKSVKSLGKRLEETELTKVPYVEEQILLKFHNNAIHNNKTILDIKIEELLNADNIIAKNIKLNIIGKQKVAIIGKNGVGKTTFIKKVYETLKTRDDIILGYMPQDYMSELDLDKTVLEYLKTEYTKQEETLIRTYLGSMKFTNEEVLEKIGNLSGGQKAKIFFVKLIVKKSNVLILDEPTRNLSPLSNPVIRNALVNFNGTIISVSHDRKYINEVCDTIYELTQEGLLKLNKNNI